MGSVVNYIKLSFKWNSEIVNYSIIILFHSTVDMWVLTMYLWSESNSILFDFCLRVWWWTSRLSENYILSEITLNNTICSFFFGLDWRKHKKVVEDKSSGGAKNNKTELYEDLKKSVRSPTTLTELNELSIEHYMEAPSAEQ